MKLLEPLIYGLVTLTSILIAGYILRNRVYAGMSEYMKADLVEWIGQEDNQEALQAYVNQAGEVIREKVTATLYGTLSGFSRAAKGLEAEIGEQAVNSMFQGNELVAGIFQKYVADKPMLKEIVLGMAKNAAVAQSQAPGGLLQAPMDK